MTKKSFAYFSSSGSHKTLEGKSFFYKRPDKLTKIVTSGLLKQRGIKSKEAAKYSKAGIKNLVSK